MSHPHPLLSDRHVTQTPAQALPKIEEFPEVVKPGDWEEPKDLSAPGTPDAAAGMGAGAGAKLPCCCCCCCKDFFFSFLSSSFF